MGWGDDFLQGIQEKVENTISGVTQTASEFVQEYVGDQLVKVGAEPTGNLSAQQIANGMTPGQPSIAPSQVPPDMLARAAGSMGIAPNLMLPILIGAGLLVVVLLVKR